MWEDSPGIWRFGIDTATDVIVVGGGWGGLATGALLAHRGLEVLLVESRSFLGGRASSLERDGYIVDYGIHGHRFGSLGAAARVYRELGRTLDFALIESGAVLHSGEMHATTPSPAGLMFTRMTSPITKLQVGSVLSRLIARRPEGYYHRPVEDLLPSGLGDEARLIVSTLSGLGLIVPDLSMASAGEFIRFMRKAAVALRRGAVAYPRGGCRGHLDVLSGVIRSSGKVRTGFKVEEVLIEEGRAAGVEGRRGSLRARAVVLAMPLPRAAGLLPAGAADPRLLERMKRIAHTSGLSWDVGLERPVSDLQMAVSTDPLVLGWFTSNIDPDLCPRGKQLSAWFWLLPREAFGSRAVLEREEASFRRVVMGMFPGLAESVEWERMLRMPLVDGAAPLFTQPWISRPRPTDTGTTGLFFAGDTVGVPGQGGDIAFESAMACSKAVSSFLR